MHSARFMYDDEADLRPTTQFAGFLIGPRARCRVERDWTGEQWTENVFRRRADTYAPVPQTCQRLGVLPEGWWAWRQDDLTATT